MKITPLLFCFLALLATTAVHAQAKIYGKITDSAKASVAFCPMLLLQASDSTQVKGNISDSTGLFEFENSKPGKYIIRFEAVGYKISYSPVFTVDSNAQVNLGTLSLAGAGLNLK